MKKFLVIFLLATAAGLIAQTPVPYSDVAMGNHQGTAVLLSNATVRICTIPTSTTTPCNTPATFYPVNPDGSCSATANVTGNTTADTNGSYKVCLVPGPYAIEATKPLFTISRKTVLIGGSGGGGGTWGTITGTLSAQGDLQAALAAKQSKITANNIVFCDASGTCVAGTGAQVGTLFSGAGACYLKRDGTCDLTSISWGGIGGTLASQTDLQTVLNGKQSVITANNIVFCNASGTCRAGSSTDVVGLFTGCSGTQYLGADGACHTVSTAPVVDVITPTRYTGRTNGTVYQNTSGFPVIVVAEITGGSSGATNTAYCDASTNPTTVAATTGRYLGLTISQSFEFICPSGYYYKTALATGYSLGAVTEYALNTGTLTDSGSLVGSRALGTIYQNTTGSVMWLSVQLGTGGTGIVLSDSNATPTTQIWKEDIYGSGATTATALVPILSGDYYEVTDATGSITGWHEYTWSGVIATRSPSLTTRQNLLSSILYNPMSGTIWTNVSFTASGNGTSWFRYDKNIGEQSAVLTNGLPSADTALQSSTTGVNTNLYGAVRHNEIYSLNRDGSNAIVPVNWYEWLFCPTTGCPPGGGGGGSGGTTITLQVNGTNTTSQTSLNMQNSTANSTGLSIAFTNPSGGNVKPEIQGAYNGNVPTATALAGTPAKCTPGNYPLGVDAQGNALNCTAASSGSVTSVTASTPLSSSGGATPNITFSGSLTESQVTGLTSDLSAKEVAANKNQPSGYAGLDSSSKLTASQLPFPGATSLGGVQSKDCSSIGPGYVLQKINADGTENCANFGLAGGSGATLLEGLKQAGTSVTLDAGYDFGIFVGSDNALKCQLSTGLGGGSCMPAGGGGTTVNVNGASVSNPNFNATTPAAPANSANVSFQVSGSSVSAYLAAASATLGLTKSSACSTGSHADGTYNTDGTPHCSADTTYTLPALTASVLGGVKGTGTSLTCSGTDKVTGFASDGTMQCAADQTTSGGGGITTLNGSTVASQTFTNETNIGFSTNTGTGVHTFTWTGTLAKARQHSATVYNDQANTITGTQTYNQAANGQDVLNGSRFTDTSPTGNFLNFKSSGGSSLFQVDITGSLVAGIIPIARVTGTVPAAQLPTPTASTLGGVESIDCTGTGHVQKINTDGTITCSADSGGGGGGNATLTAANDTTTGTTVNLLARLTSTGAIKAATTDLYVPTYIVSSGAGTSGSATLVSSGVTTCVMDATTSNSRGYYIIPSVTTAGDCHAVSSTSSWLAQFIIGTLADNSTSSGTTANVAVSPFYGYISPVNSNKPDLSINVSTGGPEVAQGGGYSWGQTASDATSSVDTCLTRSAAGVITATTNCSGSAGSFKGLHFIAGNPGTTTGHILSNAGTGATISASNTHDASGLALLTTGTGPTTGNQFYLTFYTAYSTTPRCTVSGDAVSQPLQPYIDTSTSTTNLYIGVVNAPAASTAYNFNYVCMQ